MISVFYSARDRYHHTLLRTCSQMLQNTFPHWLLFHDRPHHNSNQLTITSQVDAVAVAVAVGVVNTKLLQSKSIHKTRLCLCLCGCDYLLANHGSLLASSSNFSGPDETTFLSHQPAHTPVFHSIFERPCGVDGYNGISIRSYPNT